MKCSILTALITIFLSAAFVNPLQAQPEAVTVAQPAYLPPKFTDVNRLKKIKAALPLIQKLYRNYVEKNHLPSIAYGVVVDGELLLSGGKGFTDINNKILATPSSAFRIASMTKSFTAMAVVKLRDEGKLRLDDPVHLYIPEILNVKPLTRDAPVLTVRHLLIHAGGFPQDDPWADRQLADTDKELLQLIDKGVSYSNVPGITYEYSNLGYTMLGQIITKASGKPFNEYIDEKILKPLGMSNTYWEYADVPAQQLAKGYGWLNNKWNNEPLKHHGVFGAMGGLITSIEDFSKYMAFHIQVWPPDNIDSNAVIKNSSLREMHHPWNFAGLNASYKYPNGRSCATATAYGYGLRWTKDCDGRIAVGHSGGLPGFGSNWTILPEYGIGVVSFSNVTYAPMSFINTMVLDTLIAVSGIKPRALPASTILKQRQADLIKILPSWTNAEGSGIFAENFFLDYPIDMLRKTALQIFKKAGGISRIGEVVPQNQLRGSFILYGKNYNIRVFFTLTPQSPALIQALDMNVLPKS